MSLYTDDMDNIDTTKLPSVDDIVLKIDQWITEMEDMHVRMIDLNEQLRKVTQ